MRRVATILAICGSLTAILVIGACRADVLSRQRTRVYADGGVDRVVEIRATPDDPDETIDDDWLRETVGIELAEPEAWARLDEAPDRIRAEGYFPSTVSLPVSWSYRTDLGPRPAGQRTELEIRDRALFRLWDYRETHVDPFGPEEIARALDDLAEMAAGIVRDEVELAFRGEVDPAPAERWIREDGRGLAAALVGIARRLPGAERESARLSAWRSTLEQAGIPVTESEPDAFWSAQLPALMREARVRLAAVLSTTERPVRPEELDFIPEGEDDPALEETIARRSDPDALFAEVERNLAALSGYYGDSGSPGFRFEVSVELPGSLLLTNGTPLGDNGALFVFRAEDLAAGERTLSAISVQLDGEVLRGVGARRDLPLAALLQLVDLLDRHDDDGRLAAVLRAALEAGRLDPLRDRDALPDDLESRAVELADLLDPDVPLPEPL